MNRSGGARALALLLALLHGPSARGEPGERDAGVAAPTIRVAEVLHATTLISRMHMRCRSATESKSAEPLDKLHCTFFTLTLRRQPPEQMATLTNFAEILREVRAQCRSGRPRSEQARKACAACRRGLADECLYLQAMKDLRKGCTSQPSDASHANPALAELERAAAEQGRGARAVMQRFCAACSDDPSAQCFSTFWASIAPPTRCALATNAYELELARQAKTQTWSGNLGGPCNTQITLLFDGRRKLWTYTEVRLTPERCASGEAANANANAKPLVYSSAEEYAIADLPAMCERVSLL